MQFHMIINKFVRRKSVMVFLWMIGFVLVPFGVKAQITMQNLPENMQHEKRFIVMNISAPGCIYCKMQDKKIAADPVLKQRFSDEVYFLEWQSQNLQDFRWNGHEYTSGTDFIEKITHKNSSAVGFPLWLIFDTSGNLISQNDGLLNPKQIVAILDILQKETEGNSRQN